QEILAELRAIFDRQADDLDARLCIVGVDVNDRNLEALGEIAGVARRPRIDRIGGESNLIIENDVQCSAGAEAGQPREIELLGHHAFTGKGSIAMHTDWQHGSFVAVAVPSDHLASAGDSLQHWIHYLEMARVRNQNHLELATTGHLPLT